jgi:hypothetical protein
VTSTVDAPALTAVMSPVAVTVATDGLEDVKVSCELSVAVLASL